MVSKRPPAHDEPIRCEECDADYEWKSEAGRKQPYRITLKDGGPFAFAGLWERWDGPQGAQGAQRPRGAQGDGAVESCTIVTTEANQRLRPIHHRMPVILAPEAFAAWLDPATPGAQAQALLRPAPSAWFTAYRVSPKLNSPANDDPALIEPFEPSAEAGERPRLL